MVLDRLIAFIERQAWCECRWFSLGSGYEADTDGDAVWNEGVRTRISTCFYHRLVDQGAVTTKEIPL